MGIFDDVARLLGGEMIGHGPLAVWDAYVASVALAAMGKWGLSAEQEAHMRREAEAALAEATYSQR